MSDARDRLEGAIQGVDQILQRKIPPSLGAGPSSWIRRGGRSSSGSRTGQGDLPGRSRRAS